MFGFRKYNYENFTRDVLMKDMLTDKISGPRPGDRAPDFEGRTLEGDRIRLSDLQNQKNVVLTFGSATCPFTASSIRGMNRLFNDYSGEDVQFLFVYVREAHPGERLSAHENMKDKIRAAEIFRRDDNVEMPIIVDDVNGSIHRKYGKLPNPTYLIDRSGRVAFRSLWTRANVVEDALEELLERQSQRGVDHAVVNGGEDRSMPSRVALLHAHRALQRGGRQSLRDFSREMGLPGRMTVMSSRIAEPLAMNPGRAAAGAAITAGVIVGALYVGRWLRRKRLGARAPYEFRGYRPPRGTTGSEYEAVGI
ncbi:MAG TPA: deiodinase-like protein [Terriglobales bacterium]|nr:deiodinase-like protein [Terriglobales bacterium]